MERYGEGGLNDRRLKDEVHVCFVVVGVGVDTRDDRSVIVKMAAIVMQKKHFRSPCVWGKSQCEV